MEPTVGCRLVCDITCGTHFGDTNEVASMTGSPVAESLSISSTLTSVGTGVCVPHNLRAELTILHSVCVPPHSAVHP